MMPTRWAARWRSPATCATPTPPTRIPETYPKFQAQLGRVVLLRNMINWCVENPVRGAKLDPDGPKMRALEAYILAQRKGTPMNYGKH